MPLNGSDIQHIKEQTPGLSPAAPVSDRGSSARLPMDSKSNHNNNISNSGSANQATFYATTPESVDTTTSKDTTRDTTRDSTRYAKDTADMSRSRSRPPTDSSAIGPSYSSPSNCNSSQHTPVQMRDRSVSNSTPPFLPLTGNNSPGSGSGSSTPHYTMATTSPTCASVSASPIVTGHTHIPLRPLQARTLNSQLNSILSSSSSSASPSSTSTSITNTNNTNTNTTNNNVCININPASSGSDSLLRQSLLKSPPIQQHVSSHSNSSLAGQLSRRNSVSFQTASPPSPYGSMSGTSSSYLDTPSRKTSNSSTSSSTHNSLSTVGLGNNHQNPSTSSVKETHKVSIDYDPVSGRKVLNSYEIIKELGRGQHGKVKLAKDLETGEFVAIKVVNRNSRPKLGRAALSGNNSQEDKIRREIAILKKCIHPNIVQLREVLDDAKSRKIYLVLEYVEKGEVRWRNEDGTPSMSRDLAKSTARDVLLGLEYLHLQGIIHRDIKPANLLLAEDGTVKISDFGVSYVTTLDRETNDLELAKTAGTPAFFAPELCVSTDSDEHKRLPINHKIDIWAFGVTLFCLLYGRLPFNAESEYDLFKVIVNTPLVFPDEETEESREESSSCNYVGGTTTPFLIPGVASQQLKDTSDSNTETIKHLKSKNSIMTGDYLDPSSGRVSGAAAFDEHALTDRLNDLSLMHIDEDLELAKDLLRKLLTKNPTNRIDIAEIKRHPWISDGMPSSSLEDFLHKADNDEPIQVTGDEVQQAVKGITGKLKRGLTKFGNSALEFAGIKRRSSNSSIFSNKGSRSASQESFRMPISQRNSRANSNLSNSAMPLSSSSSVAFDQPKNSNSNSNSTTTTFSEREDGQRPLLMHNSRSIPLSSSNTNLNAILRGEGGGGSGQERSLSRMHSRMSSVAITDASSSTSSLSSFEGELHVQELSELSDNDFIQGHHHYEVSDDEESEESEDDDGELTLVLGPSRQFPSVSKRKDPNALRRTPSFSMSYGKGSSVKSSSMKSSSIRTASIKSPKEVPISPRIDSPLSPLPSPTHKMTLPQPSINRLARLATANATAANASANVTTHLPHRGDDVDPTYLSELQLSPPGSLDIHPSTSLTASDKKGSDTELEASTSNASVSSSGSRGRNREHRKNLFGGRYRSSSVTLGILHSAHNDTFNS